MSHKYFCRFCGTNASSIASLTNGKCMRHPEGSFSGRHELYEDAEKSTYHCKYCGTSARTIAALTTGRCIKHPDGSAKGHHQPAL